MIHYLRIEGDPDFLEYIPGYLEDRNLTGSAFQSDSLYLYFLNQQFCEETAEFLRNEFGEFEISIQIKRAEEKNWNAIWESNFQPVVIPPHIYIRAAFHPENPRIKYDILIRPEMAFGTGHHATTFLMATELQKLNLDNVRVLDFGCGTGVLSIIASKLGAATIDALDIEDEAVASTRRNMELNDVTNINVVRGSLQHLQITTYDLILANINKNVHLRYADMLVEYAKSETVLLISGILPEDVAEIKEAFSLHWSLENQWMKEGWVLLKFQKRWISS